MSVASDNVLSVSYSRYKQKALQCLIICQALTSFHTDDDSVLSNTNPYSVEITNKMQPCNRIYYSTVHWRLNMFRAAYRSSSGALTVFAASGLHTAIRQRFLPYCSMPLETCWAFNERWNNKFYYKVASCWLFLQSHTMMHGSMNIKTNPYSQRTGFLKASGH